MISVTINLDTSRFDRMMSDFPGAMARARRAALLQIGKTIRNHTREAFNEPSKRPAPWAPRKSGGKHALLIRSGELRNNFRYRLNGDAAVVVWTKVKYAGYHQFGTKKMPARPFFPFLPNGQIMPTVMREIEHKIQYEYEKELRKLGGH